MTNTAASTQIGLVATYLDPAVDFQTQHRPAPGQAFLCFTLDHLMLEAKLTPCASLLYHWILLKAPAGTLVSFDLKDFRAWTSEHRTNGKAYSMKQIRRALGELEDLQLVDLQSELIKGRARHPGPVVPLGQKSLIRDKNVQPRTEMSQSKLETATQTPSHSPTDLIQKNLIDNKQPTHPPVVVEDRQGEFGVGDIDPGSLSQKVTASSQRQSHSDSVAGIQPHKTTTPPPKPQPSTPKPKRLSTGQRADHALPQQTESEAAAREGYDAVFDQLVSNRIQLNKTVHQTVLSNPLGRVQLAVAAVLEYLQHLEAKGDRPKQTKEAILVKALKDGWTPKGQTQVSTNVGRTAPSGFQEWYKLAHSVGLVSAAQMQVGVQFVLTNCGDWEQWEEFVAAFPLAELQAMAQAGHSK